MANYLVGDIHSGLQPIPGSTPLQREVVERSLRYLDELARESQGDRELQLQVGEGYQKLGDVLGNPYRSSLGDRPAALETYAKALRVMEPVLRAEPTNRRARRATAILRLHQGGTKGFGGAATEGFEQLEGAWLNCVNWWRSCPATKRLGWNWPKRWSFRRTYWGPGAGRLKRWTLRGETSWTLSRRDSWTYCWRTVPGDRR